MTSTRQNRNKVFGISLRATTAALAIALVMTVVASQTAQAQTYQVIHNFTGGEDGAYPDAGLTIDKAGNLYGTTHSGGYYFGTVFKLRSASGSWVLTPIYDFQGGQDGAGPAARVVFGPDGSLYGTTTQGGIGCAAGCGTVFKLQALPNACKIAQCAWIETVLYRLSGGSDGSFPANGDLVFDPAGNLYGATGEGGKNGSGTAYMLAPSKGGWTESVLYSFTDGNDGEHPNGVIFGQAGDLYGTAFAGGMYGSGTVFELAPPGSGWTENTLHGFQNGEGGLPSGGPIFDQSGNLYGTTSNGGSGGGGTVFKLTPSGGGWNFVVLYAFSGGIGPYASLSLDAAGSLYGTTQRGGVYGNGVVFKLKPNGDGTWTYTSLHDFTGGSDGATPLSNIVFDANGNLYGTASAGGTYSCNGLGCGVIWEITP
jgi:uncharacterized repeat protein (TIGR03803 family)